MKNWIRDILIILVVFSLGVLLGISSKIKDVSFKTENQQDTININILNHYFEKHHVRFSHIVLAQAILESGNFTSKLYKSNKNLFGMKIPAKRYTFAENWHDYGNYADYESIESCILDYKSWQQTSAYDIISEEDYFNLLKTIYAQDPNYITKLKKIIK